LESAEEVKIMNKDEEDRRSVDVPETSESKGEVIVGAGLDGMGTFTARSAVDRKLRKQLMENYDLVEMVNKGRYYTAKALSKDGRWFYELLIDKQRGTLEIVSKARKEASS
jgi:hypothetical protein